MRACRPTQKYEGGLEEFSMVRFRSNAAHVPCSLTACARAFSATQGYRKYGFNREGNAIVYREWAPAPAAASLIGDFNDWNPNRCAAAAAGRGHGARAADVCALCRLRTIPLQPRDGA